MQIDKALASATGAAAVMVALTGWGFASGASFSPDLEPSGESLEAAALADGPPPVVLESVHAPGKAIRIADLGHDASTWPASSRTIPSSAPDVLAHAVQMHPVPDRPDAFVLTNVSGDVLARIDGSRDLEVRDQDTDAAAGDPLATWTVTSNGTVVSIANAAPLGGVSQALDLYDWSTADGARVGVWDDNDFGTNQSWRVHALEASVDPIGELVAPGEVPQLPESLEGTYGWGATAAIEAIEWDAPAADAWNADGTVAFTGTGTGMFGEDVLIDASFTVGTEGDAAPVALSSYAGIFLDQLRAQAPTTVERSVSGSDATVTASVEWDWTDVTQADLDMAGTIEVPAVDGLGFAAILQITLTEPARANILADYASNAQLRGWSESGSDPAGLTDGNVAAEGWGNWVSGGAANRINPDWVAFYFDEPRQVTGADIFEPTGADNIGTVTFQYRTMRGGWVDVPGAPFINEGASLALEQDFDRVLATGFRAVLEHKSDASWMRLSEIRVWGPTPAS